MWIFKKISAVVAPIPKVGGHLADRGALWPDWMEIQCPPAIDNPLPLEKSKVSYPTEMARSLQGRLSLFTSDNHRKYPNFQSAVLPLVQGIEGATTPVCPSITWNSHWFQSQFRAHSLYRNTAVLLWYWCNKNITIRLYFVYLNHRGSHSDPILTKFRLFNFFYLKNHSRM